MGMRDAHEMTRGAAAEQHDVERGFRLLYLGPFVSYGDRFAIAPLLVSISRDLEESLAAVAAVASVYFLLYGILQPVYGVLSDRVGRVRVMRLALLGMGLGNLAAAAAPSLSMLIAAKGATGAFAGGILPTSLVYVGDKVAFGRRQHVIANVLSAGAVGTVLASIGAGLLGRFSTWRLVFVIPGLLALGLAVLLSLLPESLGEERGAGPLTQVRRVARHPWALFLFALAVAEGAVTLGFLTFLAPALEFDGQSAAGGQLGGGHLRGRRLRRHAGGQGAGRPHVDRAVPAHHHRRGPPAPTWRSPPTKACPKSCWPAS